MHERSQLMTKICQSSEICDRHVTARGLCRKHYLREYRAGTHEQRPTRKNGIRPTCPPDHPHDVDTCWKQHGCRCAKCVHERAMERQRRRNRLRAYGRENEITVRVVSANPVRRHIDALHALGLGYERIGRAAGVGHGIMMDLIYGPRGGERTGPVETIRKEHADALLALSADTVEFALVDPTGTVRRLRALVAIGWSETRLAGILGMGVGNFWTLIHGRRGRVTVTKQHAVVAMFRELWDQPQTGVAADRARRIAKHYRWVGPLAWDNIDDPDEQPEGVARARDPRYTAAEYLDDVAFLLELGESPHQAAAIVGRTPAAIAKAAQRHDRADIASVYDGLDNKRGAA